jgi:hypothetical protein
MMAKTDEQAASRMPEDLHRRLSEAWKQPSGAVSEKRYAVGSLGHPRCRRTPRRVKCWRIVVKKTKYDGNFGTPWQSAPQAFDAFIGAVAILARRQKSAKGTLEGNKMFDGGPGDAERL